MDLLLARVTFEGQRISKNQGMANCELSAFAVFLTGTTEFKMLVNITKRTIFFWIYISNHGRSKRITGKHMHTVLAYVFKTLEREKHNCDSWF